MVYIHIIVFIIAVFIFLKGKDMNDKMPGEQVGFYMGLMRKGIFKASKASPDIANFWQGMGLMLLAIIIMVGNLIVLYKSL